MRLAVAAVLALVAAPAFADDFPIADVESKCLRIMRQQPAVGECIRREQLAYDYSRILWRGLSDESRIRVRQWESPKSNPIANNPAYYQNLAQAIEIERERQRQSTPPPRFRY